MAEERKAVTPEMKRISLEVVDHALDRVVFSTAVAVIAIFLGLVVLLFVARGLLVVRRDPPIQ